MKRVLLLLAVLFLAATGVIGIRYRLRKQAQAQREAAYEVSLLSFTQILKPGMNRKDVENYLRANDIKFKQTCCVEGSWGDATRIGEEDSPWFCSANNVYVAFQFANHETSELKSPPQKGDDLDTLKAVKIDRRLEGCL